MARLVEKVANAGTTPARDAHDSFQKHPVMRDSMVINLPIKPQAVIFVICAVLGSLAWMARAEDPRPAADREPRIVNIYNFVRNSDYRVPDSKNVLYETTRRQIQLLKQAGLPEHAKTRLCDGRTGEMFDQEIVFTTGRAAFFALNGIVVLLIAVYVAARWR